MKLDDLRKLYKAPNEENDDLDGEDTPVARVRVAYDVDLAFGPDATVCSYQCVKCGLRTVFDVPRSKAVFIPQCPKCDACGICHETHDAHSNPLTMREGISIGVHDGELVEMHVNVCEACLDSPDARKLGFVSRS